MRENLKHLLSASALALFVFIAFGSVGDDDSSETSNEPTATEKIQADESLSQEEKDALLKEERLKEIEIRENATIQASDLFKTYQDNEVSADNDFKGKYFYVEGVVDDIKKDILDDIYVTLKTGEMFGSVQCYLDNADVASQLKKGQRITVYGKCDGLMMNVAMKNCKVVDNLSELKNR